MAVDISGSFKHKYDDVRYKQLGEFIAERAGTKQLFLLLPYFSIFFSFFFFLFSFFNVAGGSEIFFLLAVSFTLLSAVFSIISISEQPDEAVIGVINEGRKKQLENFFGISKEKIEYYAHIGISVKEFLGRDKKEAVKKNLIASNVLHDVALDSKTYCTGYLLPGSTGSGKTVSLYTTVFLPALISGNGFYYIEGKGDKSITSAIVAMAYQFGREQDLFIFDIGAATTGKYTNGLNPLAIGSSKTVNELLKSLINIMTGDNAWVTDMMIAYMGAILEPLILLRDLNLIVDAKELKEIKNYKDLLEAPKNNFNITTLLNYMNYQAAIDLLYMMNRLMDDKEFLKLVKLNESYGSLRQINETLLGQLRRMLRNANVDIDSIVEPDYSKLDGEIQRHNTKAIAGWVEALTVFGSEKYYGNVFNKDVADVDMVDAMQTGKIIIYILPSMSATSEENKKIGGMAIALAKAAIGFMIEQGGLDASRKEQARQYRYRPRRLPYALVFDEPSNYASADIAQMASMVRSIGYDNGGMSLVWTGQSLGDMEKIDDGKKIAQEQLIANLGFIHTINVSDNGYKDLLQKRFGEHYVWREDQYVGKADPNQQISRRLEKEQKYELNYFDSNLRPETGESLIAMKGFQNEEKMVTLYNEPPETDFILNKFIGSVKLLEETLPTKKNFQKKLNAISNELHKDIKAKDVWKENLEKEMKINFTEDIKSKLVQLANLVYPDVAGISSFEFVLSEKNNPTAHGMYNTTTKEITIFNAINKNRDHLFATAIHELTHHTEYLLFGETGHGLRFYEILYKYFCYALGIKEFMFDYNEAKRLKMFDSSDIQMLEAKFGIPIAKYIVGDTFDPDEEFTAIQKDYEQK